MVKLCSDYSRGKTTIIKQIFDLIDIYGKVSDTCWYCEKIDVFVRPYIFLFLVCKLRNPPPSPSLHTKKKKVQYKTLKC